MHNKRTFYFRYLPITPDAKDWGLYVLNAGYTSTPPKSPYPPQKHPADHDFSWESGRILGSYTFVYITRGNGVFESSASGKKPVKAGDIFIVFPGVWHRYRPNPESGWDEYWVEFDGEHARRIMGHKGFTLKSPVISLGLNESVLSLFIKIAESIETEPFGFEHIVAAQAAEIVAYVLAHLRRNEFTDQKHTELIHKACCTILENSEQNIDFKAMAASFGLGYSAFRLLFKKATGIPPGQYQQQIRVKKACELLRSTTLSISQVADRAGFETVYYFSRFFKTKTGMNPSEFRKEAELPSSRRLRE